MRTLLKANFWGVFLFGIIVAIGIYALSSNLPSEQSSEQTKVSQQISKTADLLCKFIEQNVSTNFEKAAYATKGVKSAEYHLDDNTLHVILNEEKTDVLTLKKNIAKAGHDTDEVKATDEEINERALELGKIYGPKDPEKMAKILAKTQKPMIEKDIVIENTLKFIKENCK